MVCFSITKTKTAKELLPGNLRKIRFELGVAQKWVADKLGIDLRRYQKWEEGRSEPSVNMLTSISAVLGISLDDLLTKEL